VLAIETTFNRVRLAPTANEALMSTAAATLSISVQFDLVAVDGGRADRAAR
jgi:hypothetical protein